MKKNMSLHLIFLTFAATHSSVLAYNNFTLTPCPKTSAMCDLYVFFWQSSSALLKDT